MKKSVVMIGLGEMGGVISRGLLRHGTPVYPANRDADLAVVADVIPDPEAVVVAVGEAELPSVLAQLPTPWRDRLVLLQNELLPRDWQAHELSGVTVISVWFEKKPGQDFKVIIPSPVFGPKAGLIHDALGSLGIPVKVLESSEQLLFELVLKNLYILTTNIAGLAVGGDVGSLWREHESLAREVATEVLAIQASLTGQTLDRERLIDAMRVAFEGDPSHKCMGRSAPLRLERALQQADAAGIQAARLRDIQRRYV